MKNGIKKFRSPLKQKMLLLLMAGAALGLIRSPKGQKYIIREVAREWKNIDRQYLYRTLREFYTERLVSFREQKDGRIDITLTEAGRERCLSFKIDSLWIKRPSVWDKKWRVVLYDIPEKKKPTREALREKLKELGFYEWQRSVFIYPYPCRDEVDFIIEFFEIRNHVRQAELDQPTNEAELKLHFNL